MRSDLIIEIVWTGIMLLGAGAAFTNARSAAQDRRVPRTGTNGFGTVVLESQFIINVLLFLMLLSFLTTGLTALASPPDPPASNESDRVTDIAAVISLFLGGILGALLAMLMFYYRRILDRMV